MSHEDASHGETASISALADLDSLRSDTGTESETLATISSSFKRKRTSDAIPIHFGYDHFALVLAYVLHSQRPSLVYFPPIRTMRLMTPCVKRNVTLHYFSL